MSTSALSGSWTYRSFNPAYVAGDETGELNLIFAGAVLTLRTAIDPMYLEGTIEWEGGGLVLNGTVLPGVGDEPVGFDIVGTGRTDAGTEGWEYRYHGHLTRNWPKPPDANALDQRPALVGSVFRAKTHNGNPPRSPAGYVASFIAVKQQPPFTWELSGSWTYRSFHNYPTLRFYKTALQNAHELIVQEAVFKLEPPINTTLQGTLEWGEMGWAPVHMRRPAPVLDLKGNLRPGVGGEPPSFQITGTGRPGTDTAGGEYYYNGHLTRQWLKGVEQRPALVGSVMRAKPQGAVVEAGYVVQPAGYVAPFIAVKQQ